MTELVVKLPDELARQAREAGLLSDAAIQKLLEDAVRRQAGLRLRTVMDQLHAANIPPMTDEEIQAEVDAVRAERRRVRARDAGRS
jgi:hypothetical protein